MAYYRILGYNYNLFFFCISFAGASFFQRTQLKDDRNSVHDMRTIKSAFLSRLTIQKEVS